MPSVRRGLPAALLPLRRPPTRPRLEESPHHTDPEEDGAPQSGRGQQLADASQIALMPAPTVSMSLDRARRPPRHNGQKCLGSQATAESPIPTSQPILGLSQTITCPARRDGAPIHDEALRRSCGKLAGFPAESRTKRSRTWQISRNRGIKTNGTCTEPNDAPVAPSSLLVRYHRSHTRLPFTHSPIHPFSQLPYPPLSSLPSRPRSSPPRPPHTSSTGRSA